MHSGAFALIVSSISILVAGVASMMFPFGAILAVGVGAVGTLVALYWIYRGYTSGGEETADPSETTESVENIPDVGRDDVEDLIQQTEDALQGTNVETEEEIE